MKSAWDDFVLKLLTAGFILLLIACAGGYLTHIWVCVADNRAALLIVGLIFFPVGIIHGIGHWFGFW